MDIVYKTKADVSALSRNSGVFYIFVYVGPVNKWALFAINSLDCQYILACDFFVLYFVLILYHMYIFSLYYLF